MSGENQYIQPTKKGTIQNNVIKNKKQYRLKIAKKKQKEKTRENLYMATQFDFKMQLVPVLHSPFK